MPMEISKWDYKTDGYHPHEVGLKNKLTKMGFDKIMLREIKPGAELASKNNTNEAQAYAFLAGRLFVQIDQQTEAFHQGDILFIPPQKTIRFKASGNVPTKLLVGKKGSAQILEEI
jgi:mannose-6-phosphate isomerase-like protein (cupin superfamily)